MVRGRLGLIATLVGAVLLVAGGCANRGMQAPPDDEGTDSGAAAGGSTSSGGRGEGGGSGGAGGSGGGGVGGSSAGSTGRGGAVGSGGGGGAVGTGGAAGVPGSGGATGAGGVAGKGGAGGVSGSGGAAGVSGSGGAAGVSGSGGAAGVSGSGGMAGGAGSGAGGRGGTGGAGGGAGAGGAGGSTSGTGGAAGAGGKAGASGGGGAGGLMCPGGGVLDCSSTGALTVPGGQITDFSTAQWNATTSQWCDASGLRGKLFSFAGTASTATAAVDTTAQNLKLSLNVGKTDYAGGGITFESCVNASAFTSVQFTATVTSGSLTGCVWQVQLQTQDQRASTATDPSGGTCASNCYRYPVVSNLTAASGTASTYTEAFTAFTNQTGSTIPLATQIVGVQWQVNSGNSGAGTCTVDLRVDDVKFK